MKISKIFHWLYASVMLMPIFAIGVKCGYVMLNKNAKESYYGETINEYNVNVLSSYSELKQNIKYNLSTFNLTLATSNATSDDGIYVSNIHGTSYDNEITKITFYRSSETRMLIIFRNNQNTNLFQLFNDSASLNNIDLNYVSYFGSLSHIEPFLFNGLLTTKEYNDYSYLDNVFYYAVDQINNEPLFSWAQSSFLSQPLLFITNFFGVPSTSPILTILCYWFSISVIWLVFDAVMYFPLLIHRWLDKGVLE